MVVGLQLSVFGEMCGGYKRFYLPQTFLNRQPITDN